MDSDGYLWVGTGDRHMGIGPQDANLIAGKVLRIDGDGNAHPGNKFKGDKRVYSYGHRNVQGIDSVQVMEEHLLLSMDHGTTMRLLL